MTTVNASDLASALPAAWERLRQGELVLVTENGATVATIIPTAPAATPAPAAPAPAADDDDEERWWRGTYAPELPRKPIPGFVLPSEPIILERRPIEPDFSWLPQHDDDDE